MLLQCADNDDFRAKLQDTSATAKDKYSESDEGVKEKIVLVEWDDACSNAGYWDDKDPDRFMPVRTRTVGHLIKRTSSVVIVSQDRFYTPKGKNDGDRHTSTIPKKMIRKITELKG